MGESEATTAALAAGDCWLTAAVDPTSNFTGVDVVFGYGSLTWKPCCASDLIAEAFPALLPGWRRRFWQQSVDHRGTPEAPGRVCTLLRESRDVDNMLGSEPAVVAGMAYRIKDIAAILPDLDFREKNGYTRTVVDITYADGCPHGRAILYYAKPGNDPAYVGPQTDEEVARIIARSHGPSGANSEYLFMLAEWCTANSFADAHVERLTELVRQHMADIKDGSARPADTRETDERGGPLQGNHGREEGQ